MLQKYLLFIVLFLNSTVLCALNEDKNSSNTVSGIIQNQKMLRKYLSSYVLDSSLSDIDQMVFYAAIQITETEDVDKIISQLNQKKELYKSKIMWERFNSALDADINSLYSKFLDIKTTDSISSKNIVDIKEVRQREAGTCVEQAMCRIEKLFHEAKDKINSGKDKEDVYDLLKKDIKKERDLLRTLVEKAINEEEKGWQQQIELAKKQYYQNIQKKQEIYHYSYQQSCYDYISNKFSICLYLSCYGYYLLLTNDSSYLEKREKQVYDRIERHFDLAIDQLNRCDNLVEMNLIIENLNKNLGADFFELNGIYRLQLENSYQKK